MEIVSDPKEELKEDDDDDYEEEPKEYPTDVGSPNGD